MKKSLLLGVALSTTVGAFAQNNRLVNKTPVKISRNQEIEAVSPQINLKPLASNNAKVSAPPYTLFSTTRNNYGYYASPSLQNILTYNADLNTVLYVQRFSGLWGNYNAITNPTGLNPAAVATAVSGYMMTKWTTDNGASWDSTLLFRNETNWARFPSGTILNPNGNTTLANAMVVASGPCTNTGSTWGGNWFGSAYLTTGTNGVQGATNIQRFYPTNAAPVNAFGKNISFARNSTTANNGTVWVGANKSNNFEAGSYGVALIKGMKAPTGDSLIWTVDSSLVNLWTVSDGESNNMEPKIAFGPDGLTGYVLINGSDAAGTGVNIQGSYQPMVWKTTDGGATWNRVNTNFDWTTAGGGNFIFNLRPTVVEDATLPAFFDTYGGRITVDMNGVLHYVTAVTPAYSTHVDSLGYGYLYPFSFQKQFNDDRPWVWDLTTDGNGTWDGKLVAQLYTNKTGSNTATDTTSGSGVWLDQSPNTHTEHDHRLHVSRSTDGSKIFITWLESDTTVTVGQNQYGFNNLPSIHYRGLDVATGNYTPEKVNDAYNATNNGNTGFWWMVASDRAMPTATGYRIPATYSDSRNGGYSSLTTLDVYYVDDLEIENTEYTETINSWDIPVGIKEVAGTTISNVGQNFPNPFTGTTTINVNLTKSETVTLNVTNSIGQVVATKVVKGTAGKNEITVDGSSLTAGIYFYTVVAGDSKVTRKMSVVK